MNCKKRGDNTTDKKRSDTTNEIRILFNDAMVREYKEAYFAKYPKRKKFDIKATGMSLNAFTAKTRMAQAQAKAKYGEFVEYVLARQGVPKLGLSECHLCVIFKWKDNLRRDYDNYAITLKFYMDKIVEYGLIEDDSFHIVNGLKMQMESDKSLSGHQVEFVFTY